MKTLTATLLSLSCALSATSAAASNKNDTTTISTSGPCNAGIFESLNANVSIPSRSEVTLRLNAYMPVSGTATLDIFLLAQGEEAFRKTIDFCDLGSCTTTPAPLDLASSFQLPDKFAAELEEAKPDTARVYLNAVAGNGTSYTGCFEHGLDEEGNNVNQAAGVGGDDAEEGDQSDDSNANATSTTADDEGTDENDDSGDDESSGAIARFVPLGGKGAT